MNDTEEAFWYGFAMVSGAAIAAGIIVAAFLAALSAHAIYRRYKQAADWPLEVPAGSGYRWRKLKWALRAFLAYGI